MASVGYWRGCVTRAKRPSLSKSIASLLSKAGVSYVILDEEGCCGAPAIVVGGDRESFGSFKARVLNRVKEASVKTVISGCPTCVKVFREEYASDLPGVRFLHATTFFNDLIDRGLLQVSKATKWHVTYHDPCDLGRGLGEYQAPRKLIERMGLKLVEMRNSMNLSRCCGGGGGAWFAYPPLSTEVSRLRIEEALSTGAEKLLSACATCEYRLTSTVEAEGLPIACLDVLELLNEVT